MALLPPQQNQEDEKDKPQAQQPVQPTQVQPMQSNIQPQKKQPARTGTGFTNLNRIMQANTGSKLGSAVSGGITGQVQNTQKGIETAQQRFEDQAQKARLDTPEAEAARAGVLDRFDPTKQTVDESKFQVSEKLRSAYDKAKLANNNLQPVAPVTLTPQEQSRIQYLEGKIEAASSGFLGDIYKVQREEMQNEVNSIKAKLNQPQSINGDINKIEKDYQESVQAEKNAFIDSEKQRMMLELAPTDQEISDFTKYRTGTYTGPAELEDAMSLYGKAAQTEALGQLARSTGGREELLKRFVGGKDYTSGQRLLDTAILGQDRESGLGDAARQTRGTVSDVERANTTASQRAQEFAGRAKEFGAETSRMIGEKRDPISGEIDKNLEALKGREVEREANVKYLEDLFTGNSADYAALDKTTRLGLGLETARGLGYLSDADLSQMMGSGGLLERGMKLGLDVNKLIQDRIKSNIAQGMTRSGAASESQEASIRALDRLAGKVGPDVEFGNQLDEYKEGSVGFDLDSLNEYITQTEQEKAARDSRYADELAAERARYLNQTIAGYSNVMGGGQQALAGALGAGLMPLDPKSLLDPQAYLTNYKNVIEGGLTAASGTATAATQQQNAVMEGLLKLNIGGQSIANTAAGKQLLSAINLKSKLENEAIGAGNQFAGDVYGGYNDLLSGKIGTKQIAKITGIETAKNLSKQVADNVAREIADAAKAAAAAVSKATGYKGKWCFALDTIIELEKGSVVISDLKVGDEIFLGGKVLEIQIKDTDPSIVKNYNGVYLTEDHKVLENKVMVPVKNAKKTIESDQIINKVVYIVTEKHVVIANDTVFSDCWQHGEE